MVNCWQPGIQYDKGDVVEYEDIRYRAIQGHFSQSDWAPRPETASLWGRIPEHEGHHHEHHRDHDQHCEKPRSTQPPPPQQQQQQQQAAHQTSEKPWDKHTEQSVDIPHQEHKKTWYDLTPERKQQLEVGGGLVAGLAALGAGYYAYHEHEKNEEKKKANVWALQSWLADANARTKDYQSNGARSPTTWILTEGHNIPGNAFVAGDEGGKPLYICRAFCDGGIQVGKAGSHLTRGAVYGYSHKTFEVSTYEILVCDSRAIQWIPTGGKLRVDQLGKRPVEGGQENDGTPIYLAQADYHGLHPGKASTLLDGAYIAYGNEEKNVKEYSVLCYL